MCRGEGMAAGTARLPGFLEWPPVQPPGRVERPARTVDVAPTVAALLGVDPTEPIDGPVLKEVGSGAKRLTPRA